LLNPWVAYFEAAQHGWSIATATPNELRVEYRVSDIPRDGSPMRRLARFVQRRGENRVTPVAGAEGGSGRAKAPGDDPAAARAKAGSRLAARRARIEHVAQRDLERRVALAESAARRRRGRRAVRPRAGR